MDEMTLELHSPITDEEWDMISDVDFDHTNEITFHTKHGKDVTFWKKPHWVPCKERLPEIGEYVLTCISEFEDGCMGIDFLEKHIGGLHWMNDHGDLTDLEAITAWMPLPEPFKEVEE